MPKISVGRDRHFDALGRTYTEEEFEELCDEFGIELDAVTTEKAIIRKEKHLDDEVEGEEDEDEIIYKIEVPANRYDLLCLEGLVQALRVFNGLDKIPTYTVADIPREEMLKVHVKPETAQIRPHVLCAVLRDVTFDQASYKSFIDLQDKLHENICRRRTLVSIGTHDLDTIQGPFTYEALSPVEINFVPLKQVKSYGGCELMEFYKSDMKLKKFLHIIEKSPVFPVMYDHNRTVLSLPPIINSAHSAISLQTKNVFIECTATDLTKAKIVLNTMVTMFSMYCKRKFEAEPVEVISSSGKSSVYPDLSVSTMEVPLSKLSGRIGVSMDVNQVIGLLNKMQLLAEQSSPIEEHGNITVYVPPTRSDIIEICDVAEDLGIAFGYNNIFKIAVSEQGSCVLTSVSTRGGEQPLSKLSDSIRSEVAMAGFTEVLTWILGSHNENFSMLNRKDDKSTAVIISNPRSSDFEVARTSLMPGLLKTVRENNHHPKPIKIFEVGDILLLDEKKDVGATNRHHLAALYCGEKSGLEVIQGLVERVMEVMDIRRVREGENTGYVLVKAPNDPEECEFLRHRNGNIILKGEYVGSYGNVHPEVLKNFDISYPCSYMELDIEKFLTDIN